MSYTHACEKQSLSRNSFLGAGQKSAPIFVPLFVQLGVPAQTVFAAYRIGDCPANTLTPLLVFFPVIVTFAQHYQKQDGVGSVVALTLPVAGAAPCARVIDGRLDDPDLFSILRRRAISRVPPRSSPPAP
ncbi:MAG: AbgT family transporter [Verrucomicrobiota bacterium]